MFSKILAIVSFHLKAIYPMTTDHGLLKNKLIQHPKNRIVYRHLTTKKTVTVGMADPVVIKY